jgi:hypothetical protein
MDDMAPMSNFDLTGIKTRGKALPSTTVRHLPMGRFDPSDRHSEDLIAAVERGTERIAHTLREGFKLLALQIAAVQGASPDNSKAIQAEVTRLEGFTKQLDKSI